MTKVRYVVGLLSCARTRERRDRCRRTWLVNVSDYNDVDVFFVVGSPLVSAPLRADDLLILPVEDTYPALPMKVHGMLTYVRETYAFEYFLKADDDTYVDLGKLLDYESDGEYVGFPIGSVGPLRRPYAHGGSGYRLSPRALALAADTMKTTPGDEDRAIGTALVTGGIMLSPDKSAFVPQWSRMYVPTADNATVTMHCFRSDKNIADLRVERFGEFVSSVAGAV